MHTPAYQPPQQMLVLKCSFKKDSMKLTFLLAVPAQPAPLISVKKYEENEPFQVSDPKYMILYVQKKHWEKIWATISLDVQCLSLSGILCELGRAEM